MRALVPPLLAALIAGCGTTPDAPAGAAPDTFGLAVRSNRLVSRGLDPLVTLQDRLRAEAPTVVTFPFDRAVLDAPARAALDRQAHWMRRFPEVRFAVTGHADEVGPGPYNEALGLRRAEAVVAYLGARGVSRSRLVALSSLGERRPLVPGAGRERANRRAVTTVRGFVRRHPTVLNGAYAEVVFREYVASAQPSTAIEGGAAGDAVGGGAAAGGE